VIERRQQVQPPPGVKFDDMGRRVDAGLAIAQWQNGVPVTVYPAATGMAALIWANRWRQDAGGRKRAWPQQLSHWLWMANAVWSFDRGQPATREVARDSRRRANRCTEAGRKPAPQFSCSDHCARRDSIGPSEPMMPS
jgi:hypothetical protein